MRKGIIINYRAEYLGKYVPRCARLLGGGKEGNYFYWHVLSPAYVCACTLPVHTCVYMFMCAYVCLCTLVVWLYCVLTYAVSFLGGCVQIHLALQLSSN